VKSDERDGGERGEDGREAREGRAGEAARGREREERGSSKKIDATTRINSSNQKFLTYKLTVRNQ